MKAITLWQPYASLVRIKAKPFETRSYPPPAKLIGQRIAIHAAVRHPPMDLSYDTIVAIEDTLRRHRHPEAWDLPRGAVVCTAVLVGAYQCGRNFTVDSGASAAMIQGCRGGSPSRIHIPTDPFGDYSPGRWAWRLTDVQPLDPPVPAKGKQMWWEWDEGRVAA